MNDVYVIGIDPGVSTGIVSLVNGRKELAWQGPHTQAEKVLDDYLCRVYHVCCNTTVTVACERYIEASRRVKTSQPIPQQVVGVAESCAKRYGFNFVLQQPGNAKRIAPNSFLLQLGLFTGRGDVSCPDANDVNSAMRHAVLYLAQKHASLFDDMLQRVSAQV